MELSDQGNKKRQHSPESSNTSIEEDVKRRQIDQVEQDGDLLARLTEILNEIKTTPSTGEIPADLLGQLRRLMLRIEALAADDNNTEARQLKDESDTYLALWLDDLVAQCEADDQEEEEDDDDDDEETIALALALQDEEEAVNDDDEQGEFAVVPMDDPTEVTG
ncbi:uncharacterized protein BX664DRAFT_321059 [Halteromyces radiatus]|uniref:uncharacterized protein n=1 Tax=Halteromyces radiatus TaxID=101107 RepID=UPI00221F64BD|nr:uncharacterized protein BX664DRAFT_321059 [Halteromyces radiatus]KAI8099351.1 hypothetical protein BX664DRAFT_321059 [Halteromyces radiatus]